MSGAIVSILRKYGVEIAASAATAIVVVALFALLPFPRVHRATVAAAALAETTGYSLDSASIGTTTITLRWHPQPRLAPARGEAIVFAGWAVDAAERKPVTSVVAVVDGGASFRGVSGMRRDDVAAKLGNHAFASSGFRLTIPPCALAAGSHRVAFRFAAADGRGFYRSRDDVDIDVNGGPPSSRVAYAVDAIVPAPARSGPHELRGWLVDASACAPALGVRVTIDGQFVASARYGSARPDVAKTFGVAAYENSGFTARWSDAMLARGPHTLRLAVALRSAEDVDPGFALRFDR